MEGRIAEGRITTPQGVEAWEEPLVIPTYQMGAEDPHPPFLRTTGWEIYPYTMQDDLRGEKKDCTYKAVVLENAYLRLTILPELGGHLYSAYDKTNGQEMFYRNRVIKPGLIALRGAWIATGIEFNFPRGHSTTSVSCVDHAMAAHPDGSVTVTVGDHERVYRMQWQVGITLYPDRAYVETEIRVHNRTMVPNRFYWWSNAAVRATADTQFPYPMTSAYGRGIVRFPIHDGKDLSWYANHPTPGDLFARDAAADYFCCYHHDTRAGVVHVADHHESLGKKFFTWGTSQEGLQWGKVLSDGDGPYCEIQSGRFRDQGTWEVIEPHAVESWKEYWWPVKEMGSLVYANENAALGLSLPAEDGEHGGCKGGVAVNTTCAFSKAEVRLDVSGRTVYCRRVDVSPQHPFSDELLGPLDTRGKAVRLTFSASGGGEIASYTQPVGQAELAPEPEWKTWPGSKAEAQMSVQELYLVGHRKEKCGDEAGAEVLYHKALALDPGYVEAHASLGMLALKRGDWQGAETAFRKGLDRDGEHPASVYGLGRTLSGRGDLEGAGEVFGRLVRSPVYGPPAFYALGEMALRRKQFERAASLFERVLRVRPDDVKAMDMSAAALRRQGKIEEAGARLDQAQELFPTDLLSHAERYFLSLEQGADPLVSRACLTRMLRGEAQSCLELSVDYGEAGLIEEAIGVLSLYEATSAEPHAMVLYHLGYCHRLEGKRRQALKYYGLGAKAPRDYVFPHRLESLAVLRDALSACPTDANAHYYLGNLLYAKRRFQEAQASWKRSAELDGDFSVVHRNLGLAYWKVEGDLAAAVEEYERAIGCSPDDWRLYLELDKVYESSDQEEKRLALLESAPACVGERGEVAWREAALRVAREEYDRAIELLGTHTFNQWEGAVGLRQVYLDAFLGRGEAAYRAGEYEGALRDFAAALEYPANLGMGRPASPQDAQAAYLAGLACEALGRAAEAGAYWGRAASEEHEKGSPLRYYEALSLAKLNDHAKASEVFEDLVAQGKALLEAGQDTAKAHYLMGLGYEGKGERHKAVQAFGEALEADPRYSPARKELSRVPGKAT